MSLVSKFKRLGIQQRIMLYVTVGLAIMFGSFTLLGLRSIQQASELVYEERLSTAYITAGILEGDFLHVVRDVQETGSTLLGTDALDLNVAAHKLLDHLSQTDPFPFFQVAGLWVLRPEGGLVAAVGKPPFSPAYDAPSLVSALAKLPGGQFVVLPAVSGPADGVPFVTIATQVADPVISARLVVAVHTVSINSSAPYMPESYWWARAGEGTQSARAESGQAAYHLEVVRPDGIVVLGNGPDEKPGAPSPHSSVIQRLTAEQKAAALLHQPVAGETFKPHVMAAVPLASSGFHVVLEEPADEALALPLAMRQKLLLLAALGFPATLLVAWVTTWHVVKPTQQLTAAAQRMAQGDLESPVNVSAQDEVGRLAESLDAMRQQLRAAYHQLENTNRTLEAQVRERTARLEEVLGKIIFAQEEERFRLARELHDETAQTLGALSISLDRARDSLSGAVPETVEYLGEAKAIATRLLEETRRLILDLRPMALDDLGLASAIRWYAETHLEEDGVAVTVEVDQPDTRLSKHIQVSLFRIIQEAVNNIAKHAHARHSRIRLALRDSVASVVVTDDGRGFDAERMLRSGAPAECVGLLGMQERVRLLNGSIQIRSQEGKGTEVAVEIPIVEEFA